MLTSVSNPDLHLLRVFKTITEAGGFSAAQIVLNVGQSTISTQMADLEARLGFKLCRRGRSGFSLTDDGRAVYRAAIELFQSCDNFTVKINERRGSLSGELRIALADALVGNPSFPMEKIIARLRKTMPDVSIVLSEADPLEIEHQILEQRLHAGIHTFPNHAPGLRYVKLFSERQVLYCGQEHPLFDQTEPITVTAVEEYDYAGRTYYGGSLRAGEFKPKISSAKCSSMDGITTLILSGKFLGHLPSQAAKRWVEAGQIKAILEDRLSYNALFECVFSVGTQIMRPLEILEYHLKEVLKVK